MCFLAGETFNPLFSVSIILTFKLSNTRLDCCFVYINMSFSVPNFTKFLLVFVTFLCWHLVLKEKLSVTPCLHLLHSERSTIAATDVVLHSVQ